MVRRLVYIIGAPGAGKTTLLRQLTSELHRHFHVGATLLPRASLYWHGKYVGIELFGDELTADAQQLAASWMTTESYDIPIIYAEGDRLANVSFLDATRRTGREVDLIWIDPPPEVCRARREAAKSQRSAVWVRRATAQVARLAAELQGTPGIRVTRLSGPGIASDNALQLRDYLNLAPGLLLA
jgi:predicted kinase